MTSYERTASYPGANNVLKIATLQCFYIDQWLPKHPRALAHLSHVHGFVSMLFDLSRQISNEKPAKTSQRFPAVQFLV